MDTVIVLSDSDESNVESSNKNNKRGSDAPTTNIDLKLSDSESLDDILIINYQSKTKHKKLDLNDSDNEIYNLIYNETEKKTSNEKEKDWSDSDFPDTNIRKNSEPKDLNDVNLSDFEFPDTSLTVDKNFEDQDFKEKEWSDFDLLESNNYKRETSEVKKLQVSTLNKKNDANKMSINGSESDSDYESQKPSNYYELYKKQKTANKLNSDSSDESDDWSETDKNKQPKKRVTKSKKVTNEEKKRMQEEKRLQREAEKRKKEEEKIRKKEEREQERIRKQKEQAKQKALKQMNSKNRLNFNPDYSMKLIKVIFDEELENSDFFTDFIKSTEETEVTYDVQSNIVPKSITWTRKVEENYVNDANEVCTNSKIIEENHVMIIWDCKETVQHVADGTFTVAINNITSLLPNKKIYLVMYRVSDYFKFSKHKKDQNVRDEILGESEKQKKSKNKFDKNYADMPKISKKTLDKYLIEIQLFYNVSSRLIENEIEMVLLINQYTKSLALLTSKMEKRKESKLDWYVNSDNRDTVKVDKDGNGLKRYWQQQLCQFNLTSLETSEAITSVYKSPLDLMDAYEKCTQAEGELLLKDIPVRRAAGVLTAVRKIGPELSKKIYLMFTTKDGEIHLNDIKE